MKRMVGIVTWIAWMLAAVPAFAQAKNPFSVGISEGGGSATGLTGWILAQQGWFEHQLSLAVRMAKVDGSALWTLVGLSFVYGVFHAAGPGHGKAVLASYMLANERALKRGIALSAAAALLQGLVAIALVGGLSWGLHATAQRMKDAASLIETASFAGIACLGLWLVLRKGRSLFLLLRHRPNPAVAVAGFGTASGFPARGLAFAAPAGTVATSRFVCVAADEAHPLACPHCLGPDPAMLGGATVSWRDALLTVVAAGSRPCSGAILVLVFALVQGMFGAGVLAVMAMSLGVAVTTAAIASVAVLAKGTARWLARPESRVGGILVASLEVLAGFLVLAAGVGLLLGYTSAGA